jgi:hypothetical protein
VLRAGPNWRGATGADANGLAFCDIGRGAPSSKIAANNILSGPPMKQIIAASAVRISGNRALE